LTVSVSTLDIGHEPGADSSMKDSELCDSNSDFGFYLAH
jgi:hypothetical protein